MEKRKKRDWFVFGLFCWGKLNMEMIEREMRREVDVVENRVKGRLVL